MPSDEQIEQLKTWVFTLSKDPIGADPTGTGFLLDETHILTCEHVAKCVGNSGIYLGSSDGNGKTVPKAYRIENDDYSNTELDLQVLKLQEPMLKTSVFPIVTNTSEEILEKLLPGNIGCFGGGDSDWISIKGKTISAGSRLQFEGAPERFYSGSPLLLRDFPFSGVFGVATDGGKGKGNSLYTPSARIVEWLKSICDSELKFKCISIEQVLELIAFGGGDWKKRITTSWLNQWAEVDGVNSGSIEYANKSNISVYEE